MVDSKWPERARWPIARPGLKYVILAILVTGGLFYLGWMVPALVCTALTCFVTWFFRDPHREAPGDSDTLVSPADGRVIQIQTLESNPYLDGQCLKVAIFMNVFNVHVNRAPLAGVVEEVIYHPGRFFNASLDKASEHNERNALVIRTRKDRRFAVVQIAGLIARRIVNCAAKGDQLKKGVRYGMIQFGSRLDLYLPPDFQVAVKIGDKTRAGTTVIGTMI